jgi:hypothetical protein
MGGKWEKMYVFILYNSFVTLTEDQFNYLISIWVENKI